MRKTIYDLWHLCFSVCFHNPPNISLLLSVSFSVFINPYCVKYMWWVWSFSNPRSSLCALNISIASFWCYLWVCHLFLLSEKLRRCSRVQFIVFSLSLWRTRFRSVTSGFFSCDELSRHSQSSWQFGSRYIIFWCLFWVVCYFFLLSTYRLGYI